jgi:putative transposon-encoded protein
MKKSQIESQVTKIGNGAHVLVLKQWIGKKVGFTLMEKED